MSDARSPTIDGPSEHSSAQDPAPLRSHAHQAWTRHLLNTGFIFRTTYLGVSKLPPRVSYALGDAGTWIAHRLMTHQTGAVIHNLQAVFPDADTATLRRLARRTYRSYARDVVDFIRSLYIDPARARAMFNVETRTARTAIDAILAQGKGAILVGGHFGNFEIGSVMLGAYGYPVTIVAMPEASEDVNRLRHEFRERVGADTLEVRGAMDTALQIRRRLADNRLVAFLMDRHVGRDRLEVTFFGRRAFFLRTPALIGYLTGAPLLPCAIVRHEGGPFDVITGQPIYVSREGHRDTEVARAAQAFATQLEALIREMPQCWYQFYRYWDAQDRAAAGNE
jgi:lauroyl/myristoyl acyltransferase